MCHVLFAFVVDELRDKRWEVAESVSADRVCAEATANNLSF